MRRLTPSWRAILWLMAWAMLAGTGAGLFGITARADSGGGDLPGWMKPAANFMQMAAAPGWIVSRALTDGAGLTSAVVAHVISWGFVLGLLLISARLRREWLGPAVSPERTAQVSATNLSRRRFLLDAPVAVAGLGATGTLAESTLHKPWDLRTARYQILIDGLPRGLDGLRLAFISDTHLGPRIPAGFVASAVSKALALQPDLFLLGGDYIYASTRWTERSADLMRPLVDSGKPVLGVLGNHDWYGDGPAMAAALQAVGVRMIDNDRVFLDGATRAISTEPLRDALCIAGAGDLTEDGVRPRDAFRAVPEDMPRLLICHNPDAAEIVELTGPGSPRVDLMLSGHTHGGQVRLPFLGTPIVPSRYGPKYAAGLVQGPAFPVLVSRGVGMSVLPIRWGVPPEIVEVTLNSHVEPV